MSTKGRTVYQDPEHWRLAREAALVDKVADDFRKGLKPGTPGQQVYFDQLKSKKLTICVGPAGSGKSLLACGLAAQLLKTRQVEQIILTRPLVQCGRGYGFLPGEREEKIEPFMRPMLDYLRDLLTPAEVEKQLRLGGIKLEPLEDMRGSTYKKTFLICDEAQNADFSQLHMLLTRYGPGSKFAILGDVSRTQTDAAHRGENPLVEVIKRFEARGGNPEIAVVRLTRKDILRDGLVQWVDEALGDDLPEPAASAPTEPESWHKLKCPKCRAKLWYCEDGDEVTGDVSGVQCWACQSGIALWDAQDEWSPHLADVAGAADTFPQKP